MSMEQEFKIVQLEGQLAQAKTVVSRAINVLEQVRIALEDDEDPEEALRLIKEATNGQ